jgi:hypothetical protein
MTLAYLSIYKKIFFIQKFQNNSDKKKPEAPHQPRSLQMQKVEDDMNDYPDDGDSGEDTDEPEEVVAKPVKGKGRRRGSHSA